MFTKGTVSLGLMAGCMWCLGLATRAETAQSSAAAGPFKPVAEVLSLMHGQNAFFKDITELLEKPAGEKRNKELFESAQVLAELANVNRFNKDEAVYRNFATQLRDTCLELAAAVKKNDAAEEPKLKTLYQKIKNTCQACHDAYQ